MMLLHCALEGLLVSQTASSWIHFGWQSEQLDLGLKRIEFGGLRRVCLPSRDTPLSSRTQAMLSYRLRVGRKKRHSALPENTFVCKELDFDINIVEVIVGYSITSGTVAWSNLDFGTETRWNSLSEHWRQPGFHQVIQKNSSLFDTIIQ